jgi:hypothetical protein
MSWFLTAALLAMLWQQVNPGAAVIQDFQKRVADYVKLHKSVESKLPPLKRTTSQERIGRHERQLGHEIREARLAAKQGDIFTPEIAAEFRRLIALTMQPGTSGRIRESLKSSEPVVLRLRVNDRYPKNVPLQSSPPTLLMNLPHLPPEVEYRVVGHDLALLDVKANLIVDLINNAIP